MSTNFMPADRNTIYLLPPLMQDWLPKDHLTQFVVDIISQLNFRSITDLYSGSESKAYHPRILLALLFYGYTTGVFSSRKLEKATYDSVTFEFTADNNHPSHDTIATFRKRFLNILKPLFVQIFIRTKEMGLLKLGKVSLDGTKIKARNKIKEHEQKVAARKVKAEHSDKNSRKTEPKPPTPGPRDKDQINLIDEESKIMPSSKGFEQTYNTQASVDLETTCIIAAHITQVPNDKQEIVPTLENIKELPEQLKKIDTLLADTGYFSETNVKKCLKTEIRPLISTGSQKYNQPLQERFCQSESVPENASPVEKMKHRLKTSEYKQLYGKHTHMVPDTHSQWYDGRTQRQGKGRQSKSRGSRTTSNYIRNLYHCMNDLLE